MTQISMPSLTDDTGDGLSGTPFDEAYFTSLAAAIDTLVHSSTNPTVTPVNVIDEVVTARGSKSSLTARMDVATNADGTIKSSALPSSATASPPLNYILDPLMLVWAAGDTAVPTCFAESGTAATYTRCGTGLGDTSRKFGDWSLKVAAAAGGASKVKQAIVPTYDDGLDSTTWAFGAWVKTSDVDSVRLVIDDGATTSTSSYHSGGGAWEWLTVEHTISASATKFEVYFQVNASKTAYISGWTLQPGDTALGQPIAGRYGAFLVGIGATGELAVADGTGGRKFWRLPYPCYFAGLAGAVNTAPTSQAITFDCDKSTDLSSWNAIYSTKPDIDAAAKEIDGGARTEPDGTYQYRCFDASDYIRLNIDQVGDTTKGSDLEGDLLFITPLRPVLGMAGYRGF